MARVSIDNIPNQNNPIHDLQVEGNQIQPISPSFSQIGGNTHINGGTDIAFGNNIVEAQKGEPVSKNAKGDVVAWGKMKNPITKRMFESDAKFLAKEETAIEKLKSKATDLVNYDPQSPHQVAKFNTGQVLQDAAKIKEANLYATKELYSETQQMILDFADATGQKPSKLADKIAKNGMTLSNNRTMKVKITGLPKAADGKTFDNYKQYEDRLRNYLNNNAEMFVTNGVQPRNELYGQKTTQGGFGSYYNDPLNNINTVRKLQGQPEFDVTTPEGTLAYQKWYNNQFKNYTGTDYYAGTSDPMGTDSKYGNKTSSHLLSKGRFTGLQPKTLSAQDIATMSDSDFQAVSGKTKADFFKDNAKTKGIGFMGEYNFNPEMTPINNAQAQQNPTQITRAAESYGQPATTDNLMGNINKKYNVPSSKEKPSYADYNKFDVRSVLPEIAALFDRPDYVEAQYIKPNLYSPYQVSFQDQINQQTSDFKPIELALRNNPEALATLAAQKYNASAQVLGNEFRTNQGISNQVNNQNVGLLNQTELQNLQIADNQYMRQAQARENTRNNRQAAATSISKKYQQNKAENQLIRLAENMFDFRADNKGKLQNYNPPVTFNYNGKDIQVDYKTDPDFYNYVVSQKEKEKAAKSTKKRFGGLIK